MSSNSLYGLTNEQLLLVDILNSMYNDNLRQINNFTNYISNLNDNNTNIRNLLIQILQSQNRRTNERRGGRVNQHNDLGRIYLNNTPYIIDNVREYRLPSNRNSRNDASNANFSRLLQSFFQPVEVYPTQSQIESATRRAIYCDIVSPKNRSCPISLDNFEDNETVTVIRQCGHIFRTEELNTWFLSHCNCPVCRYDIRDYNSNASSEFFQSNESESSSAYSSSSLQQQPSQNNSLDFNVERNQTSNLNERTRNLRDENPSVLNIFLDSISNNQYDRASSLTDSSGNLINNILNDTLSDPSTILGLLTAFNNRNRR
jgi:hypothetical protein